MSTCLIHFKHAVGARCGPPAAVPANRGSATPLTHEQDQENPTVRIEQLEYVAAVTQHGSLRRASEQLHISQPALSEAIAKLERELGVTLLDRRRSGARISREGTELL